MPKTSGSRTFVNKVFSYKRAEHQALVKGAGVSYDDWPSSTPFDLGQTSMSWYKDTDWKVKVAKQENAAQPYLRSKWIYAVPYHVNGYGRVRSGSTMYRTDMERLLYQSYSLTSGTTDAVLADQALARFKRKLSSSIGGAQLLVPTVELRELRSTIRTSTNYSYDFVVALSKVRKTRGASFVRYMQDQWLNFSFGISPMIADTVSALQAVNNYLERPRGLHRVRSSAVKRWHTGTSTKYSVPWGFYTIVSSNVEHELKYTIDAGIDYSLVCGNDYSLAEHLGFSDFGRKIPGLLWELTPYSWIFDYFTTVGAYLEDTFVIPPGATLYLTRTRKYVNQGTDVPSIIPNKVGFSEHELTRWLYQPGYSSFLITQREVLSALPHRSLRFKTVDEIGRNAVSRLLNLSALLKTK